MAAPRLRLRSRRPSSDETGYGDALLRKPGEGRGEEWEDAPRDGGTRRPLEAGGAGGRGLVFCIDLAGSTTTTSLRIAGAAGLNLDFWLKTPILAANKAGWEDPSVVGLQKTRAAIECGQTDDVCRYIMFRQESKWLEADSER